MKMNIETSQVNVIVLWPDMIHSIYIMLEVKLDMNCSCNGQFVL